MELQEFDAPSFLANFWQKKALFIKNPWVEWHNPIDADELAGLACEEGIEARLIKHSLRATRSQWSLEHGPFNAKDFAQLETSHWTLMVQAVDHVIPQVSSLIAPFRFIPDWRIDDVMVSYANKNGGVGPHYDNYDVFLIQGAGTRKWQIGGMCDADSPTIDHDGLTQLADFKAENEWICAPGDIVYVPPGVAHNGIALDDDCMTYSIGFRAPSHSELISHYCDFLLDSLPNNARYADPDLSIQKNPGEITSDDIQKLHAIVIENMQDKELFAAWFGQYSTTSKYDAPDCADIIVTDAIVSRHLEDSKPFYRNSSSRFAFVKKDDDTATLFVDGQAFNCIDKQAQIAQMLCAKTHLIIPPDYARTKAERHMLVQLIAQGSLHLEAPD